MSIDAMCNVYVVSDANCSSMLPAAINTIKPGDYVLGHDGASHRVMSAKHQLYKGPIVCLRQEQTADVLRVTPDHLILARRRPRSVGGNRDWSGVIKPNFERAREMRKNMTPPERIVWEMVRYNKLGVKFRRQHPLGSYIPDFYSHEVSLVVEVDGAQFHGTPEAKRRDALRDELIEKKLIKVLRIPAREVFRNPSGVKEKIQIAIRDFYDPANAELVEAGDLCVHDVVHFGSHLWSLPVNGEGEAMRKWTGGVGGKENRPHSFIFDSIGTMSLTPARISEVSQQVAEITACDLEVEGVHSILTPVCIIHDYVCRE